MRKYLERRLGQAAVEGEDGFTLIELLVVLLIIGILLGIAIPTYLALTGNANTTAAQSNLQTALTGSKAFYASNGQTFTGVVSSSISGTSLTYSVGTATTSPSTIDLNVPASDSGGALVMVAKATNGKCFVVVDLENNQLAAGANIGGGITSASPSGTYYGSMASTATCQASTAAGATITFTQNGGAWT